MPPRAIIPEKYATHIMAAKFSPAVLSGGHLFLSGMTGSGPDGKMPEDPALQIRSAFSKIIEVLNAVGADFGNVVEMTSYHVGLHAHFDLFDSIRREHVAEPFHAWTAVEVSGLRREGAIVEIRIVADVPASKG